MKFVLPEHLRKWILWILEATEAEEAEFELINRVLKRYESFTVPIREITRTGVEFRSSSLVKKLLKQGFLRISKTEFELHPRHMGNRNELFAELKQFYSAYHHARIPAGSRLPCGGFAVLPDEAISADIAELDENLIKASHAAEDIFSLTFQKKALPPILISGEYLQELPQICWRKVCHNLARFAGENSDFYAEKINSYKNLLIGRPREILEGELGRIQRRTEKDLREATSLTILERLAGSGEVNRQVLADLVSPENSYILTRFSYNSIDDFDFLQSLSLLEALYLFKARRRKIGADDLLATVREAVNLSLPRRELEQLARSAYPDLEEEELNKAFSRFRELHVGHGSKHPEVLSFDNQDEGTVYLHRRNLEAFLDSRGARLQAAVRSTLERRWLTMIEQHRFEDAMVNDKAFRMLVQKLSAAEQPGTTALLRSASLYRFLEEMTLKSEFLSRLRDFTYSRCDQLFELNRDSFYNEVYRTLYTRYQWFRAIIFRIFHWLAFSVYQNQPQSEKDAAAEKKTKAATEISEEEILARLGTARQEETTRLLQSIWSRLPADILPREEIDRNITTDLYAFYGDRSEVVMASLSVIVDRNLRRIVQRAPHLEGYSQTLREYIETKMTSIIASRSDLRGKTRL